MKHLLSRSFVCTLGLSPVTQQHSLLNEYLRDNRGTTPCLDICCPGKPSHTKIFEGKVVVGWWSALTWTVPRLHFFFFSYFRCTTNAIAHPPCTQDPFIDHVRLREPAMIPIDG